MNFVNDDIDRYGLGRVLIDFVDSNKNYNLKLFSFSGKCVGQSNGFPEVNTTDRTFLSGVRNTNDNGKLYSAMFIHMWKEENTEFLNALYVENYQIDWVARVFNSYIKKLMLDNEALREIFDFGEE